ncbi:MAG TPA: multiheme c-type cytochrome [Stellaceae bacterium]|nr:multiheme c-type cytochrome [Stellaceae bacterium]
MHLGVASCAGNNCHGAVEPFKTSRVMQNEYLVWSQKDQHSKAFAALRNERGLRIAANLGLPDAEHAELCLGCHADNVPANRRGPQFQLSDGVGCEACHGGAMGWLGIHISGVGHAANIAAGMYPTDQPLARAERCLGCHVGDDKRFVTHQIMGAGHPPLGFELDTYSAAQPAHYRVDKDYVERKGQPNDMQIWAVGQASDLKRRMAALLDPNNAPKGLQPELALFDCQACHHATDQLQWRARTSTGLPPGRLRLYDATAVMLRVIAGRTAPEIAQKLSEHLLALHRATTQDWQAVQREARIVQQAAGELIPLLAKHDFTRDDAHALAAAVIAAGTSGDDLDYSAAQQQTMALGSILAATKMLSFADEAQVKSLNDALGALYDAVASDQAYRPDTYVKALQQFAAKLPQ